MADFEGKQKWMAGRQNMPTDAGSDELARLAPAIRAHSFFSARVANGHVLDKLREISDSYTRGETDIATARLRLKQWLDRNGAGKIEEPGSREDARMANLWSTARLNLILRQNARMAYAAGEWEQGQSEESRRMFPYWRYVASTSESPRSSHQRYAGKIFRKDDPIWHRIFPPWDFNCKCSVEEVAADEVEEDKVEPLTNEDKLPAIAESGFSFDPAEALRVYDPELIHSEDLRENTVRDLMEMGCIQREDGKLEMPIDNAPYVDLSAISLDDYLKQMHAVKMEDDEEDDFEREVRKKLNEQWSKLTDEEYRKHGKKLLKEAERKIRNHRVEKFCQRHAQPVAQQGKIDYDMQIKNKALREMAEQGVKCFQQIIPKSLLEDFQKITFTPLKKGRSYWDHNKLTLYLAYDAELSTVLHELSHALEQFNPAISEKVKEYLKKRTAGDPKRSLKLLTGNNNYHVWEMTRKDAFWDPYVGKVYEVWKGKPQPEIYATEVLSMGLQWIVASSRSEFLANDKEHCTFVANILELCNVE